MTQPAQQPQTLSDLIRAHPEMSERDLATEYVKSLSPSRLRLFAIEYAVEIIVAERRDMVRTVERRATVRPLKRPPRKSDQSPPDRQRDIKEAADRRERLRLLHEDPDEFDVRYGITAALRKFKESVVLELTEDLLHSAFKLGDGTETTWGSATVEEHEQRVELLMGNVQGNIDTIQRHRAAIRLITTHHVLSLAEVPDGE